MHNVSDRHLAVIILAAGQGKRMKNPGMAKVMYEVGDKPMVGHVVGLAHASNSSSIIVVVGHQRDMVINYLNGLEINVKPVVQDPQLGTGHAVMITKDELKNFDGDVLVLSGDVPLLRKETVDNLCSHHFDTDAVATILTTVLDDPVEYGRIVRREDGSVEKIVEHKDASQEELRIHEINTGIYVFKCKELFTALTKVKPENEQKEYYLTDVIKIFQDQGKTVSAVIAENPNEVSGVNTMDQLRQMNEIYASY